MSDPSLRRFLRRGLRRRPIAKSHDFLGKHRPDCTRPAPDRGAGNPTDAATFCVLIQRCDMTEDLIYLYKESDECTDIRFGGRRP